MNRHYSELRRQQQGWACFVGDIGDGLILILQKESLQSFNEHVGLTHTGTGTFRPTPPRTKHWNRQFSLEISACDFLLNRDPSAYGIKGNVWYPYRLLFVVIEIIDILRCKLCE